MQRFRVLYLKQPLNIHGQREFKSPWFYSRTRAHQAREILARKYGAQNAIVYVD